MSIVFLVVWLHMSPEQTTDPVAQFLSSYHSVKECNDVVQRMNANKELKGRVSCLQVFASLPDASESL